MSSPARFAIRMDRFATDMTKVPKAATEAAALATKKIQLASLHAVIPSGRLRNVGKNGRRLTVRYDLSDKGGSTQAVVRGLSRNVFSWVEEGTKPHPMPRLRGKTRSVGTGVYRSRGPGRTPKQIRKKVESGIYGPAFGGQANRRRVYAFGGNVYSRVFHPGTKGKHPWAKGLPLVKKRVPVVYQQAVHSSLVGAFRG